jgi:hypothetical protein
MCYVYLERAYFMTESQEGTKYVVSGRYGQFYVDRYINGRMQGNVISGTTRKKATEAANALNSAYLDGRLDALQSIIDVSENP